MDRTCIPYAITLEDHIIYWETVKLTVAIQAKS